MRLLYQVILSMRRQCGDRFASRPGAGARLIAACVFAQRRAIVCTPTRSRGPCRGSARVALVVHELDVARVSASVHARTREGQMIDEAVDSSVCRVDDSPSPSR
jgi:hypothetical protein